MASTPKNETSIFKTTKYRKIKKLKSKISNYLLTLEENKHQKYIYMITVIKVNQELNVANLYKLTLN